MSISFCAGNIAVSEEVEQITLFRWTAFMESKMPELKLLFHIPNGGKRGKAEAARFKAAGVKAGIPDLFLPVPRGKYAGLFIELKKQGGRLSINQKIWINNLERQGYCARVCYGWEQAAETIQKYLKEVL